MQRKRAIIMGAAGRDFWNFQRVFKDREEYEVVAFTAAQIPNIIGRKYPPSLAGKLYPQGITIYSEEDLPQLIYRLNADVVVFSYSDVDYAYIMHRCALVNACGADFMLLGTKSTLIKSVKPLISICAVRTGAGKSQTTRRVAEILRKKGKSVVVIRHPMPYGNLNAQRCQRFAYGDEIHREQGVVDRLHGVASADRAEVLDPFSKRSEHRPGSGEGPLVSTDHHRERTRLSTADAPAYRGIREGDPSFG